MVEANKIVKGNCPTVKRFERIPDSLKNNKSFKISNTDFSNGVTAISKYSLLELLYYLYSYISDLKGTSQKWT